MTAEVIDQEEPAWMIALRAAVKLSSLKAVAARLGYSPSAVSGVLTGSYARGKQMSLERFRRAVEGALMGATVDCPVVGELTRERCIDHQGRPRMFTSPMRVQFYRACRSGCPHSLLPQVPPEELP